MAPINYVDGPLSTSRATQQSLPVRISLTYCAAVSGALAGVAIAIQSSHSFKDNIKTNFGSPVQSSERGLLAFSALSRLSYLSLFCNLSVCSIMFMLLQDVRLLAQNHILQTVGSAGSGPHDMLQVLRSGHVWHWLLWHRFFCFIFGVLSVFVQILLYAWLRLQDPKETKTVITMLEVFCLVPPLSFSLLPFMRFSYGVYTLTSTSTVSLRATTPATSLALLLNPAPSNDPRLFALLVGINIYAEPEITNLRGAIADVRAIECYLREKLRVQHAIQILLDQEASRINIIQGFLNLRDNPNIKRGDTILIYYAGHGTLIPSPDEWPSGRPDNKIQSIIPHDFCRTTGKPRVDVIPDFTIGGLTNEISQRHGNNITVILDCCHSASGTR